MKLINSFLRAKRNVATANFEIDVIDDLSYNYYPNSNQLKSVNDATGIEEGFKEVETSDNISYLYPVK